MRLVLPTLLLLFGCSSQAELLVEVRTDLRPADEFDRVVLDLEASGSTEGRQLQLNPAPNDRYETGHRLPEIRDLAEGDYTLTVSIQLRGQLVARVRQEVQVAGVTATSLLITRDCAGVSCPMEGASDQTSCHGGLCAPPSCRPEAPFTCPPAECSTAEECPALSGCAEANCVEGRCFYEEGPCGNGMRCKVETGCEVVAVTRDSGAETDAGPPDGGRDAAVSDATGDRLSPDASGSCALSVSGGTGLVGDCFPRCTDATRAALAKCEIDACIERVLLADPTPGTAVTRDTSDVFELNCRSCVSLQSQSCAADHCPAEYVGYTECQFAGGECADEIDALTECITENEAEFASCSPERTSLCFP